MMSTTNYTTLSPGRAAYVQERENDFIKYMTGVLKRNNTIDLDYYDEYDVKLGLRNKNGTGVRVGLTQIADVQGYDVDANGIIIPKEGKLLYRGYDVDEIVSACLTEDRFGYEEVSYLLLFGKLPNAEELQSYTSLLGVRRELPAGFTRDMILSCPSQSIMNKLASCVLAMYTYDRTPDDLSLPNLLRQSISLIAQFPSLIAYAYQAKRSHFENDSLHIHYPMPKMSTAENILRLTRPLGEFEDIEAKLLDIAMILHAEHGGGNNSTFATHLVSSSGTDTYSAIAAAVGSLKGPRHGGANIAVIQMINDLKDNVTDITDYKQVERYLKRVVKGEANDGTGLIYGLGHAVYTISDPRAKNLKKMAKKLAEKKGLLDDFMLYDYIEREGSRIFTEVTGIEKVLPANVDLYSGFVYDALGIPMDLCTPIFASARISGWCAHRIEEVAGNNRIMRPAYKCVSEKKSYVDIESRKEK